MAGVAYDIPDGWREKGQGDLVGFFTSAVVSEAGTEDEDSELGESKPVALFGGGQFKSTFHDPSREGLRGAAVATAQGFAEFFIPASEHDPVRHDEEAKVDGRSAWRADYSVTPDDQDELSSTVSLIAVAG